MSLDRFEVISTLLNTLQESLKLVKSKKDGKLYKIKSVLINESSEKEKELFFNELKLLAQLTHKNIISYKEAFYDKMTKSLNMVMEYADGGDLSMKIMLAKQKKIFFKEKIIWKIFIQILEGINYLHSKYIIHRDLKSSNIYLTKKDEVKIGGLNVGKNIKEIGLALTQIGTPYFTAPEIWNQMPYNYKCDIWSLGCILYEMTTLYVPFLGLNMEELYNNILNLKYKPIPKIYSKDLSEIINLMLNKDPDNRPSAAELLNNKIIKKNISKIINEYDKDLKKFDKSDIIHNNNSKEKINENKINIHPHKNNKIKKKNNFYHITYSEANKKIDLNKTIKSNSKLNINENDDGNIYNIDNNNLKRYMKLKNNNYNNTFNQKIKSSILNKSTGNIEKKIIKMNNINYKTKFNKLNLLRNQKHFEKSDKNLTNYNDEINSIKEKNLTNIFHNEKLNKMFKNKPNLKKKIISNQNSNNNSIRENIYSMTRKNNLKINGQNVRDDCKIINKNSPNLKKSFFYKRLFKNTTEANDFNIINKSVNINNNIIKNSNFNYISKINVIDCPIYNRLQTYNNTYSNSNSRGKNSEIKYIDKNNKCKLKRFYNKIPSGINNKNNENINFKNSRFKNQNNNISYLFIRNNNQEIKSKSFNSKISISNRYKKNY